MDLPSALMVFLSTISEYTSLLKTIRIGLVTVIVFMDADAQAMHSRVIPMVSRRLEMSDDEGAVGVHTLWRSAR